MGREKEGRKKGGKRRDKTYDPHENVPLRGSLRILVVFDVSFSHSSLSFFYCLQPLPGVMVALSVLVTGWFFTISLLR